MKTKILSGLIGCLGILSANGQTITAPVGQSLTVTNPIDITVAGGSINVPTDGSFKVGGISVFKTKNANIFIGGNSGNGVLTGDNNLFAGANTGSVNTTGGNNVFVGSAAGYANTTGSGNIFFGSSAGFSNTTASNNMFFGTGTGATNTTGSSNMFFGTSAGSANTTGLYNGFFGVNAGYSNTTGGGNMFVGLGAGFLNTTGNYNNFSGVDAGHSNTTGSGNLFLGVSSGYSNTTGSNNTYVGYLSGGSPAVSNSVAIGTNTLVTADNSLILGNNLNVGIGNTAPTAKLEITAASGSGLKFTNLTSASPATTTGAGTSGKVLSVDGNGNVILVGLTGGAGTTSVGGPVSDNWKEADGYLYNNSTNGVVIKGTGLDGNALIVKGGVLSKEVNVKVEGSEAWPDYVFKPNYKRLTLGEVEKFIAINGHLPNVPSATEMVANGNNLGKTDVKLLEKVEELTLYLLEMKKANDAQAAELKSLKQQVSKLRKK